MTGSALAVMRYNARTTHMLPRNPMIGEVTYSKKRRPELVEQGLRRGIVDEEQAGHIRVYRPVVLGCSESVLWYRGKLYDGYWGNECLYWRATQHADFVNLFNNYLLHGYGDYVNTFVLYSDEKLYILTHPNGQATLRLLPGGSFPMLSTESELILQLSNMTFFINNWKRLQLWNNSANKGIRIAHQV